ncbi:bifunctional lysylphosphatidylglycerol flippase/synthetase MprF [Pseudorhodoferax sp. Leaf274]|uniref:bifunctional lysylphosphatidylglycerol flippase/synthetase MprF n=1 Tax=Pseudorhodoferax sp. Leaf274 TaxID=1736318 RepID=UPI0009E9773D|nr:bifunctional lysylphosphatidylglycerol flippase/synthetase MprF [Pseudorhodoferax sp. Leaf274]
MSNTAHTAPLPDPAQQAGLKPPAPWLRDALQRWQPWVIGATAAVLMLLVGFALHGLLREVRYAEIMNAVHGTPALQVLAGLALTAASYLALSGYDASALAYAQAKVARGMLLLTSFVAYALGNTIGLGTLTGGAVRMRLFAAAGVEPAKIAQVVAFNASAFLLGMSVFGALALLWGAPDVARLLHLPALVLRLAAVALLAGVAVLLWLCARQRVLQIAGRWTLRLPPLPLALRQLAISAVELGASALALWVLLPTSDLPLPTFLAFYAIAISASLLSHVPGGIGVFEAVMLLASGPYLPTETMLGALLLYRALYYVLPLVLATALLAGFELRTGVGAQVGRAAAPAVRAAARLSPRLLAALTLVAGLWLLVSGVTPFTEDSQLLLESLNVPLPVVEAAHFLGSVAGLGLLLVARGLLHRLDASWWAALALSIVAGLLALPKGIAWGEAALLSALAVLLVLSRRQFDRPSSLFAQRLEPGWLLAVGGVLAACVWILFFAYQEVAYSNRLWWQFELDAQAPRSLRALLGVALFALAVGLWQLMRPPAGAVAPPSLEEIERAAAIVRASPSAAGCFALVGDKNLMFSPSGKSFLMYGKQGRSWVALFGPVGERKEWADLVWRFIEHANAHGGRPAFYQVRPSMLPLFLDCGLQAFKLGEYAHVPLPEFNLKGAKRANLRSGVNRGEREGLVFEVVPPEGVAPLLPALRAVSDAWMRKQSAREKNFSVGRFDDAYLRRLPVAVVRREGAVIAFANLLVTGQKEEASIDLMRYLPDAPPGTMDYLFAKTMLHLQAEGYQRFGLGMAPMAGMAERRRAPRWQRIGRLLFEHGERFYNFRGLHSFKDKFEPVWEARYLAAPGGLEPVLVLADVATLIGGGVKGVVSK